MLVAQGNRIRNLIEDLVQAFMWIADAVGDGIETLQLFDALTQFVSPSPQCRFDPSEFCNLRLQVLDIPVCFAQRLDEVGRLR